MEWLSMNFAWALASVEVIAGDAISKLERYGIPAAIGAGLVLLLAIDD